MDRFHHRRSKSYQGGDVQVRKRVDSSFGSRRSEEDFLPFESRQSRVKLTTEESIKKLLAEEISKKMETRRRPPSVIAKLMGLETLPPSQQPVKKQQKKFSEDYLQRTASIGSVEKRELYEGRSLRMSDRDQQEFKDVYEVLEASKGERQSNLLAQKGMGNSKMSEAKMEFVRQKFMDVKRLSTDPKLQHSKEFHDALEVLDSNKDILLKFLQEPDSLFTKHLQDLQGVHRLPHPGHITVLKSTHVNASRKSDRKMERSDFEDFFLPAPVVVSHDQSRHGVHTSSRVAKTHLNVKDETCLVPTRIVVLKPNIRRVQNPRPASSLDSLGAHPTGHKKQKDFQGSESSELFAEVRDRRSLPIELEVLQNRNRGSREIAKEITRQMRQSVKSCRISSSRLRGYSGDDSSDSVSGNDSANESELMTPTSGHFYDWKNRYSPSSSYSTESSVSREAKKRLSERWRMTHKFQEVGKVGRGSSTLGEMLAMPDRETRSTTLDSVGAQDSFTEIVARNGVVTRLVSPLGISSRDGWKDECARSLPRSRSLPASSTVFGSPKTSINCGALPSERFSMLKESGSRGSNKPKKADFEQAEKFSSRSSNIRSRVKKSRSLALVDKEKNNTVHEAHLKPNEQSINLEDENLSEQKPRTLELPDQDVEESIYVTDEIAVATPEDEIVSCESPQEQLIKEPPCCIIPVDERNTSSYDLDLSIPEIMPTSPTEEVSLSLHCPVTDTEFPASCKEARQPEVESPVSCIEAGQPSPVSVLEPQGTEDISPCSDSFEKVSADLHGLRMQLQLLKLESSDAYSDGFEMMVSSDEDTQEGSFCLRNENGEVNREFSYIVDVLVDSGIHDADMDMLLITLYPPDGIVDAGVFENLEKKYREQTSWTRSERRLLFNQINSGLMEILQPHMDPHPWVKLGERIGCERSEGSLAEKVWNLLLNQGKEEVKDPLEKVLGKEVKWLDLGDDVDAVGREIARLLFDDLVVEIVRYEL